MLFYKLIQFSGDFALGINSYSDLDQRSSKEIYKSNTSNPLGAYVTSPKYLVDDLHSYAKAGYIGEVEVGEDDIVIDVNPPPFNLMDPSYSSNVRSFNLGKVWDLREFDTYEMIVGTLEDYGVINEPRDITNLYTIAIYNNQLEAIDYFISKGLMPQYHSIFVVNSYNDVMFENRPMSKTTQLERSGLMIKLFNHINGSSCENFKDVILFDLKKTLTFLEVSREHPGLLNLESYLEIVSHLIEELNKYVDKAHTIRDPYYIITSCVKILDSNGSFELVMGLIIETLNSRSIHSLITYFAQKTYAKGIKFLIENGFNSTINYCLNMVMHMGDFEIASYLISKGAVPNEEYELESTVRSLIRKGEKGLLRFVLDHISNIKVLMHELAESIVGLSDPSILDILVEYGLDVNSIHTHDLGDMIANGGVPMIDSMVKHGINLRSNSLIEHCIRVLKLGTKPDIIKCLIDNGADFKDDNGLDSLFLWLIKFPYLIDLKTIEIFIENGSDVNMNSSKPMKLACKTGELELVEILMKAGADPFHDDYKSFKIACKHGRLDMVKYLIRIGADVNCEDSYPLRIARANSNGELIQILMGDGAEDFQK